MFVTQIEPIVALLGWRYFMLVASTGYGRMMMMKFDDSKDQGGGLGEDQDEEGRS
jgi:hypothetical protein